MLLIHQLRFPLHKSPQTAVEAALDILKIPQSAVKQARIHKLSVDARHRQPVMVASVAVELLDPMQEAACAASNPAVQYPRAPEFICTPGEETLPGDVVVCGLGPAGLFAALELAQAGFRPLVLERGPDIQTRRTAVNVFEQGGALDENANIQFGEGGAGTFSDGKLTTRINDPLCARVISQLLEAGAPEEIVYTARPHIGTDLLQGVLHSLRKRLQALGGSVCFNTRLAGLEVQNGRLSSLNTTQGSVNCGALVLAVGHSARDTFSALAQAGVVLQPKPFSVGFRIEHLQADIDRALYHEAAGHVALPPGEYQLNTRVGTRGVYTFCMCPGGSVVAAQSEQGGVVTNGMSLHARGGKNANAAVVANVNAADFGDDPFKAIEFQRMLEHRAFAAGGGKYAAPAETLGSFLEGRGKIEPGRVQPSYPRGIQPADLGGLLPDSLAEALRGGLRAFGRKLQGFDAADSLLTGLETRTSSPVRLPRGAGMESESVAGLWPCGEGAGYAGGIMSAAVDGIRAACAIIERYKAP